MFKIRLPAKLPQALERRDICLEVLALARRADRARLGLVGYLLDLAAVEVDAETAKRYGLDHSP